MSKSYIKFKKDILEWLSGKTEPTLGDFGSALDEDPAIDPPMGEIPDCVCFDEAGDPVNECNNCPR